MLSPMLFGGMGVGISELQHDGEAVKAWPTTFVLLAACWIGAIVFRHSRQLETSFISGKCNDLCLISKTGLGPAQDSPPCL